MDTITNFIKDRRFDVILDEDASSPRPAHAVWKAQHVCVSDQRIDECTVPHNPAEAVIKHQFKPKHWSVLGHAFVKLDFIGFPHDTAMQMRTHQDSNTLVQSFRYTGDDDNDKLILASKGLIDIEDVFYFMPAGKYATRTGQYEITGQDRIQYFNHCKSTLGIYAAQVGRGIPAEVARRSLASGYRQNFVMSGTIENVFHWLDRRTPNDAQIEARTLAQMAIQRLVKWSPTFFEWYEEHRYGMNQLAP